MNFKQEYHSKNLVLVEQYHRRINAENVSSFFREQFFQHVQKRYCHKGETFPAESWSFKEQNENQICLGWGCCLKIYYFSKKSRSEIYRKNLWYCQEEAVSSHFESKDNSRRLPCIFRSSEDNIEIVSRTILSTGKRINKTIKRKEQRSKY